MSKMTIRDIDVKGKKCLTRVDFNVPMVDGVITDENRINGALPTIKYLMEHGAKVILCSHLGKPHNIFTPGFRAHQEGEKGCRGSSRRRERGGKGGVYRKSPQKRSQEVLIKARRRQARRDIPRQSDLCKGPCR